MSRWAFVISDANRADMHRWLDRAPAGMRIEFKEARRTQDQNALMWALLTDVSRQLTWHGQTYSPDDWKDFLMHQLGRGRWMPAEEGGMVPIGMRTSDLAKAEFGDLIEVIYSFGARNGVEFSDPKAANDDARRAA